MIGSATIDLAARPALQTDMKTGSAHADAGSAARGLEAPYFSPVFRFDPVGQELIVEFRDSATGEIEQKYPSLWIEQAYQLTGRVEAKGPVAVAHEQKQATPSNLSDVEDASRVRAISLVV